VDLKEAFKALNTINESDENAAESVENCQKWVDYDMKQFGYISERTEDLVHKAGFQIIKDDHGDYEVAAKSFESLMEADDEKDPRLLGWNIEEIKAELDKDGYSTPIELGTRTIGDGPYYDGDGFLGFCKDKDSGKYYAEYWVENENGPIEDPEPADDIGDHDSVEDLIIAAYKTGWLKESFTISEAKEDEEELPPDPEAVKTEVHTALNNLVADEIEAIDGYEDAKTEIADTHIEHKDEIIATLDHIEDEEKEHIDELVDAATKIPFEDKVAPAAPKAEESIKEDIDARPHHTKVLELIDSGVLGYKEVAEACLTAMSDDLIKEVLKDYDLLDEAISKDEYIKNLAPNYSSYMDEAVKIIEYSIDHNEEIQKGNSYNIPFTYPMSNLGFNVWYKHQNELEEKEIPLLDKFFSLHIDDLISKLSSLYPYLKFSILQNPHNETNLIGWELKE